MKYSASLISDVLHPWSDAVLLLLKFGRASSDEPCGFVCPVRGVPWTTHGHASTLPCWDETGLKPSDQGYSGPKIDASQHKMMHNKPKYQKDATGGGVARRKKPSYQRAGGTNPRVPHYITCASGNVPFAWNFRSMHRHLPSDLLAHCFPIALSCRTM